MKWKHSSNPVSVGEILHYITNNYHIQALQQLSVARFLKRSGPLHWLAISKKFLHTRKSMWQVHGQTCPYDPYELLVWLCVATASTCIKGLKFLCKLTAPKVNVLVPGEKYKCMYSFFFFTGFPLHKLIFSLIRPSWWCEPKSPSRSLYQPEPPQTRENSPWQTNSFSQSVVKRLWTLDLSWGTVSPTWWLPR